MIKQISIFAENQKGAMLKMTGVLVDANINMYSLITNDSAEFGIVRILTSDSEKAARVLQEAGYLCHLDDVIALEISDAPGSLHHLLRDIHYSNVNIDYLYVTNLFACRLLFATTVLNSYYYLSYYYLWIRL